MMKIIKKNEIGIDYECFVVGNIIHNDEVYVIYTDFVNDINGDLRLFVVKLINDKLIDIDKSLEKKILDEYKKVEINFIKKISEEIK